MTSARYIIDEERRVWRCSAELLHARDRFVRHIGREVVPGLADPWKNLGVVAEQIGRPLVGFATHETVEIIETHSRRPLVERTRHAVLEGRRVVILAKPRCGVAVAFEDRT